MLSYRVYSMMFLLLPSPYIDLIFWLQCLRNVVQEVLAFVCRILDENGLKQTAHRGFWKDCCRLQLLFFVLHAKIYDCLLLRDQKSERSPVRSSRSPIIDMPWDSSLSPISWLQYFRVYTSVPNNIDRRRRRHRTLSAMPTVRVHDGSRSPAYLSGIWIHYLLPSSA